MITIEKTGEHFRLVFDTKGRFAIHRISSEEANYKLCRVKSAKVGPKGIPYINTHDGRTIRYPDPAIKVNDTVKFDIASGKVCARSFLSDAGGEFGLGRRGGFGLLACVVL